MANNLMDISEDWQSRKTTNQANRYMWTNKLNCDITFIVGGIREKIEAHKYVLMTRSCVFYAMIAGPFAQNTGEEVEIPDIDPETFNNFMLYIYCDEIKLNLDNVLALLYLAKKYQVMALIDKCLNKLKANMIPSNVCTVMETAHTYSNEDLRNKCRDLILRNPKEVFQSEAFSEICSDCLASVIKEDSLPLEEAEIFEAVIDYAGKRCSAIGMDGTPENRRHALGDALQHVRFPLLDKDYYVEKVEPTELLNDDQNLKLMRFFLRPANGCPPIFNSNKRKIRLTVSRFDEMVSGWGFKRDKIDSINFTVSSDVMIHGIEIYGSDQGPCDFEIQMILKQLPFRAVMAQKRALVETDGAQKVYPFVFDKPQKVAKDKMCEFSVLFKGKTTYYGQKGVPEVEKKGVKFTFSNSEQSTNNTKVERGQIPGIIFELMPEGGQQEMAQP